MTGPPILLADDDPQDLKLITRAFEGLHYPIQTVTSGVECMGYLAGDPPFDDRNKSPFPALLLLDIRMPFKDGLEVLRWIREQPQFGDLRVVMLTGSDKITDMNLAYQLGADSFFVKPLDFGNSRELFQTVERLLKGKRRTKPDGE